MELKFMKKQLECMRPFYGQIHTQEQTQEIRLPDGYPDIGKILGCWGKPLIRGKEWRSASIGANGGIMVWVMYAPEDGSNPRVLDTWLSTQCSWDFPESAEDGVMVLHPLLSSLDCRGISARKMMIRASLVTFAQAMRREKMELAEPGEIPEDIQLLKRSYPMELPIEAGEKQVQMEEILPFNSSVPIYEIVHYDMIPTISEQKVLGNRLVFKGENKIRMAYLTEDGSLQNWEAEVPFSQYTELDRDYGTDTKAWILPVLTAMELEQTEDRQIQMRAGIAAQYTIFENCMVDTIEDAFSPIRDVDVETEQVQLPALLDAVSLELALKGLWKAEADKIISTDMLSEYPKQVLDADATQIRMDGNFQILYENDGQMMIETGRAEGMVPFASALENQIYLWPGSQSRTEIMPSMEGQGVQSTYPIYMQVYSGQTIPMVTQLEVGEQRQPDPERPSMILRRAGEDSLWELAKGYGSTVAAIQKANGLTDEPEYNQMLLIPVR